MIYRCNSANRIVKQFVACDIENRSDGTVLAIDTYDGSKHYTSMNWQEWYTLIVEKAKHDKSWRTIYAYNGGGWDWLSFVEWVISVFPSQRFNTIENNGRIIAIFVPLSNRVTIRLCDAIYLFGSPPPPLDKVSRKFLNRGKIELEHLPEWYYANDPATFWRYLPNDTELVYDCLVAFCDTVYAKISPIAKIGLTLPSTSMKCFTTRYLGEDIGVPTNEDNKKMLRAGYAGGRVEVFKAGYYPKINVYDFNSLYPSVMATTAVPITGNVRHTRRFEPGSCGVYRIRFEQGNRRRLPLLMVNGLGAYSGEGVYYTPEIRRLLALGAGRITILEGMVFLEQAVIFRDYVNTLYSLRMEDKDSPLGEICKLLMNSLYGKFAQKPERTQTAHLSIEEAEQMVADHVEIEPLNEDLGIYRITENKETQFTHVGVSGTITSEARARLWEAFDEGTVYCDTDSIHTTMEKTPSKELGELKLEYSGEACYAGKKLYALRDKDGKEKVRAKGIRIKKNDKDKNGFDLSFDGLRTLLDGGTIACTFKAAQTSANVMRGKRSCIFVDRTRTIRKTAK